MPPLIRNFLFYFENGSDYTLQIACSDGVETIFIWSAPIHDVLGDEHTQPQTLIQLAHQKQTAVGSNARVLETDSQNLRSQIVISKRGGRRYLPYAFTEQGVAMLSSALRSKRAIQVNIAIMRTFVRLRQILATHRELAQKLEELEKKYDAQFKEVFEVIQELMEPSTEPERPPIGFAAD